MAIAARRDVMHDVLGTRGLAALQACAATRPLVGFDFDGTLAPIVARPDRARPRRRTRLLLARLSRQTPCAVLTGRSRADVVRALGGSPLIAVIGNHGAEIAGAARPPRVVARWRDVLGVELAGHQGVWIEDKRFSISVHYRLSRQKAAARRAIWRAASQLPDAAVMGGRDVVNIVPRRAPDKGRVLDRLRLARRRRLAIYVGDDETDEPAFARARAAGGLAIRVGLSRRSHATHFLRRQRDVDALLLSLVQATASKGATARPRGTRRARTP